MSTRHFKIRPGTRMNWSSVQDLIDQIHRAGGEVDITISAQPVGGSTPTPVPASPIPTPIPTPTLPTVIKKKLEESLTGTFYGGGGWGGSSHAAAATKGYGNDCTCGICKRLRAGKVDKKMRRKFNIYGIK